MAMYEELCLIDILSPMCRELSTERPLKIGEDHQVRLTFVHDPNKPWIQTKGFRERQCGKWQYFFSHWNFIPRGCRHCWKVVWTGSTLDQLFQILEIQEEDDLVSKCGIELRPYTGKLGYYQAFWYSDMDGGLKGGRKLWKRIVDRLAKSPLVAGHDVFLKRGCTEMERRFHPSDSWDKIADARHWDMQEMLCDSIIPDVVAKQNEDGYWPKEWEAIKVHVKVKWLEWAWEHKDSSATSKYPNKYFEAPLVAPALRYNKSIHSEVDYGGYEPNKLPDNIGHNDADALTDGPNESNKGGAEQIITEL
jgi:hypothetical protein